MPFRTSRNCDIYTRNTRRSSRGTLESLGCVSALSASATQHTIEVGTTCRSHLSPTQDPTTDDRRPPKYFDNIQGCTLITSEGSLAPNNTLANVTRCSPRRQMPIPTPSDGRYDMRTKHHWLFAMYHFSFWEFNIQHPHVPLK